MLLNFSKRHVAVNIQDPPSSIKHRALYISSNFLSKRLKKPWLHVGSKRYNVTSNIHAKYEIINIASACVYHSTSTALAINISIDIINNILDKN